MNILRRLFGRKPRKPKDFTVSELRMFRQLERDPWFRHGIDLMIEEKLKEEKK